MKGTEKMINKLLAMGMAKEWVKGDMHRYYIQLGKLDEAYEGMADAEKRHARLPLNRREREGGKLWIEADTLIGRIRRAISDAARGKYWAEEDKT